MVNDAVDPKRLFEIISGLKDQELRVYASLLFWLACRSGELLPYQHYKSRYKRGRANRRRLYKDESNKFVLFRKKPSWLSYGVNVDDIEVNEDHLHFKYIPVFKTKKKEFKEGFVFEKGNPLYADILDYVLKRKSLRESKISVGNLEPVRLFSCGLDIPVAMQRYFWKMKKRLYRAFKKVDASLTVHSLRYSRATMAGNASGDPFYVKSITGHKSIEMVSKYVKGKNLLDNMKRYEVKEE